MPFKVTAIASAAIVMLLGFALLLMPQFFLGGLVDELHDAPELLARRWGIYMLAYAFIMFRLHDLPAGKPRRVLAQASVLLWYGLGIVGVYELLWHQVEPALVRIVVFNFALGSLFVMHLWSDRG